MRFGVLGTGMVGQAVGGKLAELGHEVMMGSRTAGNEKAVAWAERTGGREGTFADAAAFGEIVVNATRGERSLEALQSAGSENIAGKILIDIADALQHDAGFPAPLVVCNTDSLGEQIQRAFPKARVVKTLNTVNISVMVNPASVPGDHVVFVSGNDEDAKRTVVEILGDIGWPEGRVYDLGDISTARGPEMYMALWLRLIRIMGGPGFNIELRRATS